MWRRVLATAALTGTLFSGYVLMVNKPNTAPVMLRFDFQTACSIAKTFWTSQGIATSACIPD